MLKIISVGLGPLGARVASDLEARGLGRIVGAVDVNPELVGKDFHGATVTEDLGDALAAEHDAVVVTTASDVAKCADTFRTLLGRGETVVSTCEELLWPWLRHEELAGELDEIARANDGRLLGTGINPGYVMDSFAVAATAACNAVRRVDVWRIQDATTRRIPFQQKIGATLDMDAFRAKEKEGTLRHVGLGESLYLLCSRLGLEVAKYEETLDPVVAETDMSCDLGAIPAGNAAGVLQVGTGWNDAGDVVARLEFRAAIGQSDPMDRVLVDGDPPIDLVLKDGVHGDVGTSAMVINAIRPLRDAAAGLHTMDSIRLMGFDGGER